MAFAGAVSGSVPADWLKRIDLDHHDLAQRLTTLSVERRSKKQLTIERYQCSPTDFYGKNAESA
jgi:hypothetical protein